MLVPTTCFNCESACGLLAYVDKDTLEIRKFEGNPEHPGSRGRNCAKGPATLNQINDPDRILLPAEARRASAARASGSGSVGTTRSTTLRRASAEPSRRTGATKSCTTLAGPGEDGYTERVLAAWGIDGHNSHTNICSSSGRGWLPLLDGLRSAESRLRQRRCHPAHQRSPRVRSLLQPARAAHHRGEEARRQTRSSSTSRLSNTATHADYWISPYPGTEAAILLAIASDLIRHRRYDRDFVRRWWNWREYLRARHPTVEETLRALRGRARARVRELHVRVRRQGIRRRCARRSPRWPSS